jgi:hypothetical protein
MKNRIPLLFIQLIAMSIMLYSTLSYADADDWGDWDDQGYYVQPQINYYAPPQVYYPQPQINYYPPQPQYYGYNQAFQKGLTAGSFAGYGYGNRPNYGYGGNGYGYSGYRNYYRGNGGDRD